MISDWYLRYARLTSTDQDVFTNVHQPWLFMVTNTVPGPLMMAEAGAAAYKTVPEGFMLDSLQTHFMLAPTGSKPLVYRVQRLSQGRRFAVRIVNIEQDGKVHVAITTSFVSNALWTGRTMTHAVPQKTDRRVREITLDDFELARSDLGPFMKFQRLPFVHEGQSRPRESMSISRQKKVLTRKQSRRMQPRPSPRSLQKSIRPCPQPEAQRHISSPSSTSLITT